MKPELPGSSECAGDGCDGGWSDGITYLQGSIDVSKASKPRKCKYIGVQNRALFSNPLYEMRTSCSQLTTPMSNAYQSQGGQTIKKSSGVEGYSLRIDVQVAGFIRTIRGRFIRVDDRGTVRPRPLIICKGRKRKSVRDCGEIAGLRDGPITSLRQQNI
ncbi:hypothetical protein BDQ12DRAFT_687446 [Crucibulum laeve]|uniref:Uncharacterized protein n=1 Tax=Crucibulum laeve TaxID=68775 RepID=A0A5C3M4C7_9AGAR|nr:hypothetical protein BDQ12DRAFT_687446 [Crucibulum laeve]